jgi:hypothetical protein
MKMRKYIVFSITILLAFGLACATYAAPKLYATGNVLAAGNYNNSATSSDLTLIIKMTAGNTILIDEGSEVRYLVPTADVNGWTEKNFNDSGWTAGISGVGYADNDDNTVITGPVPSVYTRYHFDAPTTNEVTFLVDFDDFYIIWLNGEEVARAEAIKNVSPGKAPGFDELTKAGVTDHESSDTAAGKPNAVRWENARIVKHVVAVEFDNATSVSPKAKLTATWGDIKLAK